MRVGLDAAGWDCVLAVDNDAAAVRAHSFGVGEIVLGDVLDLPDWDIPHFNALVAGFPCQPFSTSGPKLGFDHRSGNVFLALMALINRHSPDFVILENVPGLLSHDSGRTFNVVLGELTRAGYRVDWATLDLSWFGVPQTRPRVFLVARPLKDSNATLVDAAASSFALGPLTWTSPFSPLFEKLGMTPLVAALVTKPAYEPDSSSIRSWPALGAATGASLLHGAVEQPRPNINADLLRDAIAPNFERAAAIEPVRFYARGKPTFLYRRAEPIGYCLGNIPGGAPLFATALDKMTGESDRVAFCEHANWVREQDGYLVVRIRPERAVYLFGAGGVDLIRGLAAPLLTLSQKYQLVGNMVAPAVAQALAGSISRFMASEKVLTDAAFRNEKDDPDLCKEARAGS